jgi:hypothetical protein
MPPAFHLAAGVRTRGLCRTFAIEQEPRDALCYSGVDLKTAMPCSVAEVARAMRAVPEKGRRRDSSGTVNWALVTRALKGWKQSRRADAAGGLPWARRRV